MIAFGPISSRRLGKSLGINNIPSRKVCSYSCIYCQVGITSKLSMLRQTFYEPSIILAEVEEHLQKLDKKNIPDYLTFVSNGEPTLDKKLGLTIRELKKIGIPIAVITNGSLLSDWHVQKDISEADLVSVKVDTARRDTWEKINRPVVWLNFEGIADGLKQFASRFKGKLITETMLVHGINDSSEGLEETAAFVALLNPLVAYISIPIRPPAITMTIAPEEEKINEAWQIFAAKQLKTELLTGFEGIDAGYTGNAIDDILNITTVHPLREDSMTELLKNDNNDFSVVKDLIDQRLIKEVSYNNKKYYIRHFHI